jgi:hypothetical protein
MQYWTFTQVPHWAELSSSSSQQDGLDRFEGNHKIKRDRDVLDVIEVILQLGLRVFD